MKNYVGIDFGGTFIKAALVSESTEVSHFDQVAVPKEASQDKVVSLIANLIESTVAKSGINHFSGVGIACAGPVDFDNGTIQVVPNFPHWKRAPLALKELLSKSLSIPIAIENDTTAAAMAEYWVREDKNPASLVTLNLGTGLGGGVVVRGKPIRGLNFLGGEIGHVPIDMSEKALLCVCGKKGCAETVASATALVKKHGKKNTAKEIYELAKKGNLQSENLFKEVGEALGVLIASVINILDPQVIVIGGGMSRAHDLFMLQLKESFQKHVFMPHLRGALPIEISSLSKTAGLMGAVKSVIDITSDRKQGALV